MKLQTYFKIWSLSVEILTYFKNTVADNNPVSGYSYSDAELLLEMQWPGKIVAHSITLLEIPIYISWAKFKKLIG